MQNLVFLNSFQLTYPANAQNYCANVFSFITFDVVYMYLSPKMLEYFDTSIDIVTNDNFSNIGLSSNFLILNMSSSVVLLFLVQPLQIVLMVVMKVLFPKVKFFKEAFEDFFWNGFLTVLNSGTSTSLICALITILFFVKNQGLEGSYLLGPQLSLAASCIIVIVLSVFPVAIVLIYKLKGPNSNNDSLIASYERDRLGLNICILFYMVDYLSQVLIVLVVMFMQNNSLAQVICCFLMYSAYWVLYFQYMPFERDLDDHIAVFN